MISVKRPGSGGQVAIIEKATQPLFSLYVLNGKMQERTKMMMMQTFLVSKQLHWFISAWCKLQFLAFFEPP